MPGKTRLKSSMWLSNLGASLTSPDSLVANGACSTCRAPVAWIADGCSLASGAFVLAHTTRLDHTRWRGQIKHAMKCSFFRTLPMQYIKQDHILRGVVSETKLAIFWVGADGASMLDGVSSQSKDGMERSV